MDCIVATAKSLSPTEYRKILDWCSDWYRRNKQTEHWTSHDTRLHLL